MKISKLIILSFLTLAVSFTPRALAVENSNSNQSSIINETNFTLEVPLPNDTYRISSNFGVRINPETMEKNVHNGIDYVAIKGTEIYAANDGVVSLSESTNEYGETIIIKHNSDFSTLYGHILPGSILVKAGDTVKKGQKIAEVGSSGTTGNHLHFSVFKQETAVNPSDYLNIKTK